MYRIWVLVAITILIFANLGIQPARASSPSILTVSEQLGKVKLNPNSSEIIDDFPDFLDLNHLVEAQAALQFSNIDSAKNILSAKLNLYILSYSGRSTTLTVGIGENSWTSSTSNVSEFPKLKNGLSANYPIGESTSEEPSSISIDVTALLNAPTAIDGQKVTFLISSNVDDIAILKDGNSVFPALYPTLEITYAPANNAPTDITLDNNIIGDNQPAGTTIGTFSATDLDEGETFSYALVAGEGSTHNDSFAINGNELKTASMLASGTYSIRVRVADNSGGVYEKPFSIIVTNTNQAPTDITLSSVNIAENEPINTLIGTLTAIDPDAGNTFTYALVTGIGSTDNGRFTISGNELRTASIFDYEMKSSYSIRIRVTDNRGATFEKAFTIMVTDVNEAPTGITLSSTIIDENQPIGTTVGTLTAADPDVGDTFTYSLVEEVADNASFEIIGNKLIAKQSFDYEVKNSYIITVRATDSGGLYVEKTFTITVNDVPEDPEPTIISTIPVNNATDVAVNPTLTLIFSENVSAVTGKNIYVYNQANQRLQTIAVTSGNVTINGPTVNVLFVSNLSKGMTYYVLVDDGAFVDSANQPAAGITSPTTWRFTTVLPSANADLSNLTLSAGSLNFSANTTSYEVPVAHSISTITITPSLADSAATLKLNGASIASGQSSNIPLNVGSNTVTIEVTAENGVTKTYNLTITRAIPPLLTQVTNVSLSALGVATWTDIENEVGYELQLLKDGVPVGTSVSIGANTISHDFLQTMRANGAGDYSVTVRAKGDGSSYLDAPISTPSNTQTVVKLATPTGNVWQGNIAKWQAVPDAVSYYVILYRDGNAIESMTIHLPGDTQFDYATTVVGDYTFSVQAKGNTSLILDGEFSAVSPIYHIAPATYTVEYAGNGHTAGTVPIDNNTYLEHDTITVAENSGNLSKVGHTFVGWNTLADGMGITYQPQTSFAMGTENITFYAKWQVNQYTVTFETNGGEAISAESVAYNSGLIPPQPTKQGHTFVGWYKDVNFEYLWNSATDVVTGDITLYAKWLVNQYTVTFETNGGNAIAAQSIEYNKALTLPQPTRRGYTFAGWYKDAKLEQPWNAVTDVVKGDITLYAKWAVTDGGTNPPTPVPPSTNPVPTPSTQIVVEVESDNGEVIARIIIKRTTNSDGTVKDEVILTEESIAETIAKLKEKGANTLRLVIPDEQNLVSQIDVSILANALKMLKQDAIHLDILTNNAEINVVSSTLATFDGDLYFSLIPIRTVTGQSEVEQRLKQQELLRQLLGTQDIKLLGQPMKIETNIQNRPVTLTLPLFKGLTNEQLAQLAVFIEHSDGTNEIVRGQIVDFQNEDLGLQFEVNKFSTFSLISLPIVDEPEIEKIYPPYIQGYGDSTFRLNAAVTRAQIASMFARHLTNDKIPQVTATFTDTAKHGAKDAIEYVRANGLFNGVTEMSFQPNESITRAQMAAVAVRWIERQCALDSNAFFCTQQGETIIFEDVQSTHWAARAISKISSLGIMTGVNEKQFNPNSTLTRAQAVKVLNRLFERPVPTEVATPFFKDVPANHWAFFEIYGAALPHKK